MSNPVFRAARRSDVPAIVAMLADDHLGAKRESLSDLTPYLRAFDELSIDPNQHLVVAELDGEVVGTMQITYIPGLSRRGATRSLLEGVRVRRDSRRHGIGERMIRWAIDQARQRGCANVQFTTDKSRVDAHRFYERLGFEQTHFGYKMLLD